jgi:hypothetical protein
MIRFAHLAPGNRSRQRPYAGGLFVVAVASVLAVPRSANAHNPDTSYARFTMSRDEFSARLTYDVTSLVRIRPGLDADGDHRLTPSELQAAVPAIADFLRRTIAFELNVTATDFGELQPVAWPPDAGEAIAEKDYHAPTSLVSFDFRKPLSEPPTEFWVQFEFFETLGTRHTVLGAIAHDGCDDEVLFSAFEPDYLFETSYASEAPAAAEGERREPPGRSSADESSWDRLRLFFRFGVEHILIGYDHILFLVSLLVVSRFGELVKIVTSFTVAHSITLALATLKIVELPSNWVEIAIAATIVYTAVENFRIRDTSGRWKLTFVFGLIHGFGFAGVLGELQLPTEGFVRSLLAFNLGVEAGQLAIVAALALPVAMLRRWKYGKAAQFAISAAVALCGLGWFLDRAFGLELMPF